MFASLLPGLRDFRTPLATGYLYLLTLWVLLGDNSKQSIATSELGQRISGIANYFGASGKIIAVSTAAYLLGSILTVGGASSTLGGLVRWILRESGSAMRHAAQGLAKNDPTTEGRLRARIRQWGYSDKSTSTGNARVGQWISTRTERLLGTGRDSWSYDRIPDAIRPGVVEAMHTLLPAAHFDTFKSYVSDSIRKEISTEFHMLTARLRVTRESIWDDFDRLRSEAEFRLSISPPLAGFVAVAGAHWTRWALLGLLLPMALILQGGAQHRAANGIVWEALINGVIESPTMQSFEQTAMKPSERHRMEPWFEDRRRSYVEYINVARNIISQFSRDIHYAILQGPEEGREPEFLGDFPKLRESVAQLEIYGSSNIYQLAINFETLLWDRGKSVLRPHPEHSHLATAEEAQSYLQTELNDFKARHADIRDAIREEIGIGDRLGTTGNTLYS